MASSKITHIIEHIKKINDLPTLPGIAAELLRMAHDPRSSMPQLSSIIERDPALSAKVLKVVNSPFYGMRQKIGDLDKALVILGMREIVNLVSGLLVFKTFSKHHGPSFDRRAFWLHSAACAVISRSIALRLKCRFAGEDFVGGLIHDIGKIVLDQFAHEDFMRAVDLAEVQRVPLYQAEEEVLGISHAQVGEWLAMTWGLPEALIEVIAEHHCVELAGNQPVLVATVHVANQICKIKGLGFSGYVPDFVLREDPGWLILQEECPQLGAMDMERFMFEIDGEIEKAKQFLALTQSL
jgi:putative nucleotidyltransferase with HDIG domain